MVGSTNVISEHPKNTAMRKLVFLSIDISCTIIAGADFALHNWKITSPPMLWEQNTTAELTAVFVTNNLQPSEKMVDQ